ncbi:GNAT family N-acetyltransferase [Bartonella tamiae]|nr:N-acetyltransferase family protein [Bartonella tamiae]
MIMLIRHAEEKDLNAITAIYNDAVEHTLAIWNEQKVSVDERITWWKKRQSAQYPVLVACDGEQLCGYASYGPFRPFEGYKFSAELSLYIDRRFRSQGIGKKLLRALIDHAKNNSIHVLIAGIESSNQASIGLHHHFGFEVTATMPEVGYKKGQWLNLILMQKTII